jgi:hypothetical protein
MSTDDNKLLVRRQFEEIWNGGNWAPADELYARNMSTTIRITPVRAPDRTDSSSGWAVTATSCTTST